MSHIGLHSGLLIGNKKLVYEVVVWYFMYIGNSTFKLFE